MTIKVLRDYCIFILAVTIFLSSCQLTTTGEKKSVLDEGLSTEEQAQSLKKDVKEEETNEEFVQMYVNERTIDYGPEGRKSVRLFLKEGQKIGMIREDLDVDALEVIGSE